MCKEILVNAKIIQRTYSLHLGTKLLHGATSQFSLLSHLLLNSQIHFWLACSFPLPKSSFGGVPMNPTHLLTLSWYKTVTWCVGLFAANKYSVRKALTLFIKNAVCAIAHNVHCFAMMKWRNIWFMIKHIT